MGFFFRNRISGKELYEERRRKGKGHFNNGQVKRQKKRYSSSCSSHNNSCSLFDRLPDDILVHILSFMSTKRCVRSSILGKRWRFLWAHVPNLDFDTSDHQTLRSFSNFFNRFVFFHKGHNINTFNIACEEYEDKMEGFGSEYKSEIERLIGIAIECNVQYIDIHSDLGLVLPQGLFTCKTLVELTLKYTCESHYFYSPSTVPIPIMTGTCSVACLPSLEKLELINVRYESEESLVRLLSRCPALEELTIEKNDEEDDADCVFVSSPTLPWLNLNIHFMNYDKKAHEVKLDTPSLEYLKLYDSSSQKFSTGMLASLTKADVIFIAPAESVDNLYSRSILEFVSKLNNVSSLKLRICFEVPDSAWTDSTLASTEFRNLTKLELAGKWRLLTTFLENSDNLQVLSVDMYPVDKLVYWMEPKQVPVCLRNHLRRVSFSDFECSEPEFIMVKYVLKHAKVLTTMEIRVRRDLKKEKEALERITLFERASEACVLTVKDKRESLVVGLSRF